MNLTNLMDLIGYAALVAMVFVIVFLAFNDGD